MWPSKNFHTTDTHTAQGEDQLKEGGTGVDEGGGRRRGVPWHMLSFVWLNLSLSLALSLRSSW